MNRGSSNVTARNRLVVGVCVLLVATLAWPVAANALPLLEGDNCVPPDFQVRVCDPTLADLWWWVNDCNFDESWPFLVCDPPPTGPVEIYEDWTAEKANATQQSVLNLFIFGETESPGAGPLPVVFKCTLSQDAEDVKTTTDTAIGSVDTSTAWDAFGSNTCFPPAAIYSDVSLWMKTLSATTTAEGEQNGPCILHVDPDLHPPICPGAAKSFRVQCAAVCIQAQVKSRHTITVPYRVTQVEPSSANCDTVGAVWPTETVLTCNLPMVTFTATPS